MKRSQQIKREVRWALWLTLFYLVGWVVFAYFLPFSVQERGILGFPIWFEAACIGLPILFVLLTMIVTKGVYKTIDLGDK